MLELLSNNVLEADFTDDLIREAIDILGPKDFFPALAEYDGHDFIPQKLFVDNRARFSLAGAAARTGKTYGAADQFANRIAEDLLKMPWEEEKLYWCVAPTHQLNAAQAKQLKRLVPDWMIDWDKMWARSKEHRNWGARFGDGTGGTLYLLGNITIELRSAHNPESLVAEKVRGIWVTEIAKIKLASWANLYERLGNYPDSWLIGDTTPMGHNWFYRDVWEKAEQGRFAGAQLFHWTAYDSPYVSDEIIAAAKESLSSEFFERGYLASWGAFYGKIYTAFNKESNTVSKCPFRVQKVVISADLNANTERPAAFGTFLVGGEYKDPTGETWKRLHLAREFYEPIGLNYEGYADAIKREVRRWEQAGFTQENGRLEVVLDPSAHKAFKKMLRDRGIIPKNAKNDVKEGIMTFGGAMNIRSDGKPLFTVSKDCIYFPREINGYAWKVNGNGVALEEPDKTLDDHLLDCGRYAAMRLWDKSGKGGKWAA